MPNPIGPFTAGPLATADADAIVLSTTPTGAGNLSLVSSPVTLDEPRCVLVTFGAEAVARTIKIYGTNADGNAITETLDVASGAGSTVSTVQFFASVTRVEVFAAWTAALTVGTSGVGGSRWYVTDFWMTPFQIDFNFIVDGTINYTIEKTNDDPNQVDTTVTNPVGSIVPHSNVPAVPRPDATMNNLSANSEGAMTIPCFAWRLKINSGTGSVQYSAIQAG